MKKFFIKDLANMVEKEIATEFLLRNVKLSIADGRRWQDLTLSDKSGIVYGKCWSEHISDETDNYVGKIVRVVGKVELFREQCTLRIVRISPAETYDPADFRVTLSSYDVEQSITLLKKLLDEIEDPKLYSLCCAVFGMGTARYERFLEFPLTEEATHPYFGGFLKHTINVANLADMALTICEGSPNEVIRPDPSLVIAGALLHASGVLSQLTLSAAEGIFTDRARLLSSSTDAVLMAVCTNSRLEQEKRVTDMSALLHILEAANGTTPPKTKEAVIVTNAVRMSKELNSIDQIFFESDRMHPTDKTRKAFCDYLGYEVFRGGEECVKNALKQYMDKGQKNAQHLILSGPQGTGKRTCADILAHFLLDIRLDKPLHSCADFFCLDCDQASIKLSDTEDLREFISYSSTVRRVVLIDNANQMTPNVANSLLKELEDGQCVFIFIAHKPLIRTVCSRCFEIRFLPVNEDDMAQFFMEQGDLVSLEVVTASNGCPGLFRQLNADDAFISMTARMIKALNQQNHADLLSTFGLLKEKDEFALEAFSPAARLAIVRLLEAIYADQYLHKLVGSKLFPYMTELPISAKQAYQISEQAHNIRGKKLLYTKHDFLELLFQMMKEGEL